MTAIHMSLLSAEYQVMSFGPGRGFAFSGQLQNHRLGDGATSLLDPVREIVGKALRFQAAGSDFGTRLIGSLS